jgi:hypothetical protein
LDFFISSGNEFAGRTHGTFYTTSFSNAAPAAQQQLLLTEDSPIISISLIATITQN